MPAARTHPALMETASPIGYVPEESGLQPRRGHDDQGAADLPWWRATSPSRSFSRAEGSDLNWDPLLMCVAAYILTAVGRVHQLFPVLEQVRPAILTGGLAIVLYLVDRDERRSVRHLLGSPTTYLLAFLAWMMFSTAGSPWPGNSFDLLVGNFVKTVLMYFVVAGSIRGIRDVERLAAVYFIGAAVYAAVVVARFDLGNGGEDWRLGKLYYYDANDFATFAVTALPLGVFVLHSAERLRIRLLAAGGLTVLTMAFVWSGSRGGFVALIAVAGFIVLRYTGIPLRWRVTATALVALTILGTASGQYWQQMETILSDADYNRTGETGRLQIWRRGVGYMGQFPVLGVGPSNFQTAEGTLSPLAERQQFGIGVKWAAAHNSFIQAGAELGVPGLMLYLAMLVGAFGALRRAGRVEAVLGAARSRPLVSSALTASLIGFVVGSLFLSLAYSEMLYTLVAFAVGLQKSAGTFQPA